MTFLLSSQIAVMPLMGIHTAPQNGPREGTALSLHMSEPPSAQRHAGHLACVTHGATKDCSHWVHREGRMKPVTEWFTKPATYVPLNSVRSTHLPY